MSSSVKRELIALVGLWGVNGLNKAPALLRSVGCGAALLVAYHPSETMLGLRESQAGHALGACKSKHPVLFRAPHWKNRGKLVFFSSCPYRVTQKKHKPSWVELLDSLKLRSKSELPSRVAVPFLD